MTEIETAQALHAQAMELAEKSNCLLDRGQNVAAMDIMVVAFLKAKMAADMLCFSTNLEPTRSLVIRSAASLALGIGQEDQAILYAAMGITGTPPADIKADLFGLLDKAIDRRVKEECH